MFENVDTRFTPLPRVARSRVILRDLPYFCLTFYYNFLCHFAWKLLFSLNLPYFLLLNLATLPHEFGIVAAEGARVFLTPTLHPHVTSRENDRTFVRGVGLIDETSVILPLVDRNQSAIERSTSIWPLQPRRQCRQRRKWKRRRIRWIRRMSGWCHAHAGSTRLKLVKTTPYPISCNNNNHAFAIGSAVLFSFARWHLFSSLTRSHKHNLIQHNLFF